MKIGFLGFGEAGRAFQESLTGRDPDLRFAAYDILLDQPETAEAMRHEMERRGVVASGIAGLRDADWVFSAVTADQCLAALQRLVPHLVQGQVVIDINSVSPDAKRAGARLVEAASATYVDMAVMAPVQPLGHRAPVLVAGPGAGDLLPHLQRLAFAVTLVGDDVGAATAIKMVRSLFVKGLEAITVEALLAAEASGCFDAILRSLSTSFPGLGWPAFAEYQFDRTLRHGKRRAAEVRECAATLDALGLSGPLAAEIAGVQERVGTIGVSPDSDLAGTIAAVLRAMPRPGR